MKSQKRIRKVFEPIGIISHVEITGNPAQIHDGLVGTYIPDYRSENVVLKPVITANTSVGDSSWDNGVVNSILAIDHINWIVNGRPITSLGWTKGVDYVIDNTATNDRGTLTIKRNLPGANYYDFQFECQFNDSRTGKNISVQTDPVNLACTEVGSDEIDMTVVGNTEIIYDPLLDKLKLYDWKVAHGKIEASDTERNKCFDGNQYLRTYPIKISRGSYITTDSSVLNKLDVKLFAPVTQADGITKKWTEIKTTDSIFLVSLTKSAMTLDLRFLPDETPLRVSLFSGTEEISTMTFTFKMTLPFVICEPTNDSDFKLYKEGDVTTYYRYDQAHVESHNHVIEYPEAFLQMEWYTNTWSTDNKKETRQFQGSGPSVKIDIKKAFTHEVSGVEKYEVAQGELCYMVTEIEYYIKAQSAAITVDEDGNTVVTNNSGEVITTDILIG